MKKSFFQKTYNTISNFLLLSLLSLSLSFSVHIITQTIKEVNIPSLTNRLALLQSNLETFSHYANILSLVLVIGAGLLFSAEITKRFISDSPLNYFKSVYQTIRLRQFLRQDENSEPVSSVDNHTAVTKFNPIIKSFNQTISKCTVDVRKETVTVLLKYPKTQQAQRLFKEMEAHIKEEIASRNPNYYFSSPKREGNKLWFTASRR